jgi:hypothetical protein
MEGLIPLIADALEKERRAEPPMAVSHQDPEAEIHGQQFQGPPVSRREHMKIESDYPGRDEAEMLPPTPMDLDFLKNEWREFEAARPAQAAAGVKRGAKVAEIGSEFIPGYGLVDDAAKLGLKFGPGLAVGGIRKIKALADDAVELIGKATKSSDGPFRIFQATPQTGDQYVVDMAATRYKNLDEAVTEAERSGLPYKVAGKGDKVYAAREGAMAGQWQPPPVDAKVGPVGMIIPPDPDQAMGAYARHYGEGRSSATVPTLELGKPPTGTASLDIVGKGSNPLEARLGDPLDRAWNARMTKQGEAVIIPATATENYYIDPVSRKPVGLRLGAIHGNEKTGLSLDFSTLCGKRCTGKGPCLYCYVDNVRISEQLRGARKASTSRAKGLMESPYMSDILTMPDEVVKNMNATGGMRMFSFGDFRPGIDDLQVKAALDDARKRGLKIKAITKEAQFIEQFAKQYEDILTINASWDELPRGVSNAHSLDELVELKKRYPNVRIRTVALNEDQLVRHLEDPRIDVVTPYHGVSDPKKLLKLVKEGNVNLSNKFGDDALLEMLTGWKDMGGHSFKNGPFYTDLKKKYPSKLCCVTGNDFTCPTKCGTANLGTDITEALGRIT